MGWVRSRSFSQGLHVECPWLVALDPAERGAADLDKDRGRSRFIHPDDIADVATAAPPKATTMARPGAITWSLALSYGEMAATIGGAIGKRVRFEEILDQQAYAGVVRWAGKGPYGRARRHLACAVREGRPATVSDGVSGILG